MSFGEVEQNILNWEIKSVLDNETMLITYIPNEHLASDYQVSINAAFIVYYNLHLTIFN